MFAERPGKKRSVPGRRDLLEAIAVAGAVAILPEEAALAAPAPGGIAYVASNPAHSFRGLHESLIDCAGNQPEFLLCTPAQLGPALGKAIAVVRSGTPPLVDVVVQAR